jgi:hypothetical protein
LAQTNGFGHEKGEARSWPLVFSPSTTAITSGMTMTAATAMQTA